MSDGPSGALVRRQGALTRRSDGVAQSLGAALSTAAVSFGGEAVTWASLPRATRRAAHRPSEVIIEAAHAGDEVEVEHGRPVQVVRAWRAHPDGIVLARASRPVRPAIGGGSVPAGPWKDRGVRHLEVIGPPRVRRGVVAVEDELDDRTGGSGELRDTAPEDHRRAAEAWRYLPAAVRGAAEAAVRQPSLWWGDLLQQSTVDGFPATQEIVTVRLDGSRAVAIHATRSLSPLAGADVAQERARMAALPWVVEQLGYDMAPPGRAQVGTQ